MARDRKKTKLPADDASAPKKQGKTKLKRQSKKLQYASYKANDRWTTNKLRRVRRHIRRMGLIGVSPLDEWADQAAVDAYKRLGGATKHLGD